MQRYGQIIKVQPDKVERYKELHRAVWPKVLEKIQECNLTNYSIYFHDDLLFAYFEYVGEDFEKDMDLMAQDPLTQEWWDVCKPCQQPVSSAGANQWWVNMEEVFHCD